jgi:hypothetical protein
MQYVHMLTCKVCGNYQNLPLLGTSKRSFLTANHRSFIAIHWHCTHTYCLFRLLALIPLASSTRIDTTGQVAYRPWWFGDLKAGRWQSSCKYILRDLNSFNFTSILDFVSGAPTRLNWSPYVISCLGSLATGLGVSTNGGRWPVDFSNEWAIQILVLLSSTLQHVLLAGSRNASAALRLLTTRKIIYGNTQFF